MTDDEQAELRLLRLASERGKFAVALGHAMPPAEQLALERLQEREWIRLIDVSPIAYGAERGRPAQVYRVFLLTKPALAFLKRSAN